MANKKYVLTSSALLILNFVLKILYLRANSIAADEPFTIYHAQMSVPSIIDSLKNYNNPPLYEIMLHYWMQIFGTGDLSVRFLPLLFSTMTVFFVFKIGYKFFNYRVAIVAGLLFSFSSYEVIFSHETRVYAFFALLTAASMYFFFEIINHSKEKKYVAGLVITNALLLYSHYFGAFVLIIQGLSVLSIPALRKQFLKLYFLLSVAVVVLYIPQIKILLSRFGDSVQRGTWLTSPSGLEELYNMLWKFSNKPITTIACVLILLSALVKIIIKKDYQNLNSNSTALIVVLWFLFPFLFMFFISYRVPMFLDRYLIFVSIGYYLVLAIAVNYLSGDKKAVQFILPSVLVLLFIVTFNPNMYNRRPVKATVEKVMELKDGKTSVLICPFDFLTSFAYYYDRNIFMGVDNSNEYGKMAAALNKENIYPIYTLKDGYAHTDKILYLDTGADFNLPGNEILNTLKKDYELLNVYSFPEIFYLYEFVKKVPVK